MWKQTLLGAALAAAVAGPVPAQNLDLDEMAAALALPVITGEFQGNTIKISDDADVFGTRAAYTLATITNGRNEAVRLKVDVISADTRDVENSGSDEAAEPTEDNWQSTSFECDLTARETTTFVFTPTAADRLAGNPSEEVNDQFSEVYVECSNGSDTAGNPQALFVGAEIGILFIAAADPETGETISEDVLFGDAVVVDIQNGHAVSFSAIGFQAGQSSNDGDKVYRFDGDEYAEFPAVLATNFIAPIIVEGDDPDLETELILFTLDGTTGNIPTPRVKVGGFGYNDDEVAFDFTWEFDCMDIVDLSDLNPNFLYTPGSGLGLGSMSGHLEIVPQPIASPGPDVHDAQYGDANNVRRRAVHGWIIQEVDANENLVNPGDPIPGTPAVTLPAESSWGRPLAQSTTALIPFLQDANAVLDADARN